MADKKISELTAAATAALTDEYVIAAGGVSRKVTGAQILAMIKAGFSPFASDLSLSSSVTVGGATLQPDGTFARTGAAYLDGVSYASGVPRFPSQSGTRGLMVEEAATNRLAANAQNFTTGSGGWAVQSGSSWVATPGQADPYGGTGAVRVVTTGGTNAVKCYNGSSGTAAVGTKYSGMAWVKNNSSVPVVFYCMDGGGVTNTVTINQADGWKLAKIENVTGAGAALQFMFGAPTAGQNLDFTAMEPMTVATAYIGTYHPPGATRGAETTTVPTQGLLTPSAGSVKIRALVEGDALTGTTAHRLFETVNATNTGRLLIYVRANGYRALLQNAAGATTEVNWTGTLPAGIRTFEMVWKADRFSLWVDGVERAWSTTAGLPASLGANAYIGSSISGSLQWNSPIFDAAFYDHATTSAESTSYASLAPDFTAYYDWTQGVLNPEQAIVKGMVRAEYGLAVKSGPVALPSRSVADAALSANVQLKDAPNKLPSYTKTTLPAQAVGTVIYVSDLTGGAECCFSDGTNWRRFSDRSIAS